MIIFEIQQKCYMTLQKETVSIFCSVYFSQTLILNLYYFYKINLKAFQLCRCCLVSISCPTLCNPHGVEPITLLCPEVTVLQN